jgi:site-specific DNA recombinase
MDKKVAAIYPRKSRENAVTLEGQINACVEWCERNNVEYEIFAEEGSASSEDWDRPKLQEMIKGIENLEFNLVVVTEQTRICRDDHFPIFKEVLRETETLFVTADNNSIFDFANPDDELKSDILQAVGKNELSRTKIRLKRGTVQSAKKGNYQGKKAPMGYDYDHNTKRLRKNKDADVVRRMFELYLEGYSTVEISFMFNQEKVLAHHKVKGEMVPITWGKSTVARSLKNVIYAGHTLFGKTKLKKIKGKKEQIKNDEEFHILVKHTHAPIVSDEEWDRVQELMNKKRTQPPAMKHAKHVFSGLVVCASCGKVHTFERQQDTRKEWRISSCTTRNYNEDFTSYKMCGNSGSKLDIMKKLFFATLDEIVSNLENYLDLIKKKKISDKDKQKKKDDKKKAMMLQVESLQKKSNKIESLIEEDFYDAKKEKEKKLEVKQMQIQIKNLEDEIEDMNQKEEESESVQVERVLNNIKKFLQGQNSDMSAREQNDILHEFIEKIHYSKKGRLAEVEIEVELKEEYQDFITGN